MKTQATRQAERTHALRKGRARAIQQTQESKRQFVKQFAKVPAGKMKLHFRRSVRRYANELRGILLGA